MSRAKRFLLGFACGIAGLVLALVTVFVALERTDRLKAPAFANRLSFDEKLRHMRRNGTAEPRVLFVGSSTTLHGVDGEVFRNALALNAAVANLGVQDLRVNQSRFMAEVFLAQYDQVGHVVMVSTMLDFKDCATTETAFFNPEHAIDYVNGGSDLYYHFKYFDLEGVLKRTREIRRLRNADDALDSVSFDDYGGLLLEVPRDRINPRVWEGDPITLDPECYNQLEVLARDLQGRGIQFTYVISPMRPGYLADRDPDGRLLARHHRAIEEHLGPTETVVIDAHAGLDMPEEAFFDAYHLNRDKARQLTRYVGEQMIARLDVLPRDSVVRPAAVTAGGKGRLRKREDGLDGG